MIIRLLGRCSDPETSYQLFSLAAHKINFARDATRGIGDYLHDCGSKGSTICNRDAVCFGRRLSGWMMLPPVRKLCRYRYCGVRRRRHCVPPPLHPTVVRIILKDQHQHKILAKLVQLIHEIKRKQWETQHRSIALLERSGQNWITSRKLVSSPLRNTSQSKLSFL